MAASWTGATDFLRGTPEDVPVTVIGVGSNLLVREGGVPGVVVRLGREFMKIEVQEGDCVRAGTAALDVAVARAAQEAATVKSKALHNTWTSTNLCQDLALA